MGIGVTDLVTIYGFLIINILATLVAIIEVKPLTDNLQRFLTLTETLCRKHGINGLVSVETNWKSFNSSRKNWATYFIVAFIGAILWAMIATVNTMKIFEEMNMSTPELNYIIPIIGACWVPFGLSVICPISVISIESGFNASILFTTSAIDEWKEKLNPKINAKPSKIRQVSPMINIEKKPEIGIDIESFIEFGFDLINLTEVLNDSMGKPMARQYFMCLINIIIAGFGCTNIFLRALQINAIILLQVTALFVQVTKSSGFRITDRECYIHNLITK